MSGNRFEDLARDELDRRDARRAAEAKAATALADAGRLAQLNLERKQTNFGNTPEEVWGPEAQAVCSEFLEFVGRVSLRPNVLLGAYPLRTPPKVSTAGWNTSGYGVAFVDPKRNTGYSTVDIGRRGLRGRAIVQPGLVEPQKVFTPDVFLCTDGLIRHHSQPLDLVSLDGRIKPPVTGMFNLTHNVRRLEDSYTVNRDGQEKYSYVSHEYTTEFTELKPIEGLERALAKHAADILADADLQ